MKENKKLPYIEVLLIVVILLLFTTAHYLLTIAYLSESGIFWMGIEVSVLIVDIVLYSAIFLSFILLILIIHRNFTLKKRKKLIIKMYCSECGTEIINKTRKFCSKCGTIIIN